MRATQIFRRRTTAAPWGVGVIVRGYKSAMGSRVLVFAPLVVLSGIFGAFASLLDAMSAMSSIGETFTPAGGDFTQFHSRRFTAFEALQQTARSIMAVA